MPHWSRPNNAFILPSLLNRQHKVMIYGRVGQPSHRAIYWASFFIKIHATTKENKVHQRRTRELLKLTSRWKKSGQRVLPTKANEVPRDFWGVLCADKYVISSEGTARMQMQVKPSLNMTKYWLGKIGPRMALGWRKKLRINGFIQPGYLIFARDLFFLFICLFVFNYQPRLAQV